MRLVGMFSGKLPKSQGLIDAFQFMGAPGSCS
jgi:hypothetical protein